MKRLFVLVLSLMVIMSIIPHSVADAYYDITPFKENPSFEVEYDDMDDTCEITIKDSKGSLFGSTEGEGNGILMATLDIKAIPDYPPLIRISFIYMGSKNCFVEKFIIKPDDTRYTFDVSSTRKTELEGGNIYELFGIVLTPKSMGLLEDLLKDDVTIVKYRLDGSERDIDGNLLVLPSFKETVKELYDAYKASGALENDFSVADSLIPVTIK